MGEGEGVAPHPDWLEPGRAVAMEAEASGQAFEPPVIPLRVSAGAPCRLRQIFQPAPLWMGSPAWVHLWRDRSKLTPLCAAVAPLKSLCRSS